MKIEELLKKGQEELEIAKIEESNLKIKILLSNLMKKNKEYFLIHNQEEVLEKIKIAFFKQIEQLKQGVPIQYIIGKQEFYGLEFIVTKEVLIPQPDTEILVEEVLNIITTKYQNKNLKILDLCTGSGAIAIALKKNLKNIQNSKIEIYASDISEKALEIAQKNAKKNETEIIFVFSNMFESIKEKFDIIVSNPPYIETEIIKTLSKEVKKEPNIALDGGQDGLKFYREIAKKSKNFLNKDSFIAIEIGYQQKKAVEKIFKENNYNNIYSKKDFNKKDRIIVIEY